MQKNSGPTATSAKVKIEVSACVLSRLITNGFLRGEECRCLDSTTKRVMWQSLLNSSLISETES